MPSHFDARFCAMARRYRYVIYNDQIRPAHMAEEVTWNHRPLDIDVDGDFGSENMLAERPDPAGKGASSGKSVASPR